MPAERPTPEQTVERYLAGAGGDKSEASSALTHDGPEGATAPAEVWIAAVQLLIDRAEADGDA